MLLQLSNIYEDLVETLDSLSRDERPCDSRSLNQLRADVRLKDDDDTRRRMASGNADDRGGFRGPGSDVYSVGLLSSFGHRSNYVHDPIHAVCLWVTRPLFKAIEYYGSGTSLYNAEDEKLFGRESGPVPVWAWPNNTAFPAKVKSGGKWSSPCCRTRRCSEETDLGIGRAFESKEPLVIFLVGGGGLSGLGGRPRHRSLVVDCCQNSSSVPPRFSYCSHLGGDFPVSPCAIDIADEDVRQERSGFCDQGV